MSQNFFRARARWSGWETAFWLCWAGAFFVPGANLALLTQVLIWGLFALSLDLLLGYRGIPSLGHAAFFGIGAYTAGYLGKFGWTEPISGLVLAALMAGLVGLATGRIVRGLHGVGLLMVTLGLNLLLYDFVHRSTALTGGDDGL
ncbi:MAG TPA: branched-chain amino acid ABC transporter permease, partial [Pseudorhodoferax sp.]|nr:branched-chain amino acid ABC transporter permease [Pseudorhodoferax sp.]